MRWTWTLFLVAVLGGCRADAVTDESDAAADSQLDPGQGDGIQEPLDEEIGPETEAEVQTGLQPDEVYEAHTPMRTEVMTYLAAPEMIVDGFWQLHYGDGRFFGPTFDILWWMHSGEEEHRDRALAALDNNLALVEGASGDPMGVLEDMEQVAMALLGLLDVGQYIDSEEYRVAASQLLRTLDTLVRAMGDYLETEVGTFASGTYGPTAVSGFMAMAHLEHALAYPDVAADQHIARAVEILEHIHERAWAEELQFYRFSPENADLYLYPNVIMMIAYGRLYQLTRDPAALDHIEAVYAGIQPLKQPPGDHYASPYSFETMGATDPDYATLSAQNYLMLGLLLAYNATGDDTYLEEIDTILTFLETRLLFEGQILHHWMDGRAAIPEDDSYYCSGCNLQTLYIMEMLLE